MINTFLKLFVWLHNSSYKVISKLAIRANGGVHPKHEIINYSKFFVDNISLDDTVLDMGCGEGQVAFEISKKAKKVVAVDLKESKIKNALMRYKSSNLEFVIADVLEFQPDPKINKIILSNILEHIENRVEFLKKMHEIGDGVLIRVPMITRDWLSVYKKQKGFDYRLDRTHFIEYSLESLFDEFKQSGWEVEKYFVDFGEFYGVLKKYE